jgi:UDP:flavonoid glycosyltransferase YjiC (YdhE family)
VLAPIRHDQPVIAAQVAAARAGLRVKFGRVRPDQLAAAVSTVLGDPSYRVSAAAIAESFRTAGGAKEAVRQLQRLQQTTSFVVQHSPHALA